MQTGFMRGGRGRATGCISQCIMTVLSLPLSLSLRSWPCQTSLEASKISQLQQQQEQQQHMLAVRCSSPVELLEHAAPSHSLSNGGGRQVRGSMEVQYGGHHFFQLPEWIDYSCAALPPGGRGPSKTPPSRRPGGWLPAWQASEMSIFETSPRRARQSSSRLGAQGRRAQVPGRAFYRVRRWIAR